MTVSEILLIMYSVLLKANKEKVTTYLTKNCATPFKND